MTDRDDGQTVGLYIVAVAAFLFLAFAFFAVGQAAAIRNGAQTAADAAALAAATEARDGIKEDFLEALKDGDLDAIAKLLQGEGLNDDKARSAADFYASENQAEVQVFSPRDDPHGYEVIVIGQEMISQSVVEGADGMRATARATAVIDPLCEVGEEEGSVIKFNCNQGTLSLDPTSDDFELNLADVFSVHLSD